MPLKCHCGVHCGVDIHAHVIRENFPRYLGAAIPADRPSMAPAQARKLFYDTLVFDTPTLQHLVTQFGASQLMIGTDYPFNFHDQTPVAGIQQAGFDDVTNQRLLHANARRFLGQITT